MEEFVLKAEKRSDFGKRAARKLRRDGRLPANIYGHKEANVNVTLNSREFQRFFEAGHRMATIDVDGAQEHGVIKEVQYDGLGSEILHVDFTRVGRDEKIELEVPIETFGVVTSGVSAFSHHEVRVRGRGQEIPERIEIRVGDLAIGESIRVKDIEVPPNCEILDDPELVVFAVNPHKGEEAPAGEEGEARSEPEVIGKPKDEDEGGDS